MTVMQSVFDRWGVCAPDEGNFGLEETGEILAISIGLGSLFNESVEAERAWMASPNKGLNGGVPINWVLAGQTRAVLEQVNIERGL